MHLAAPNVAFVDRASERGGFRAALSIWGRENSGLRFVQRRAVQIQPRRMYYVARSPLLSTVNNILRQAERYCDEGDSVATIWPGERMAHTGTRAVGAERASQSSVGAARESDDGFDFPPTAHPGRELFTASLFVLLIMALLVWGGWKLTSLVLTSLI
jgi:hypothetical protein